MATESLCLSDCHSEGPRNLLVAGKKACAPERTSTLIRTWLHYLQTPASGGYASESETSSVLWPSTRGVLGLKVSRDEGSTLTLGDMLVLEEHPGIARRPARPVTTGLYHVTLLVPSRRELGRSLLGLQQAGYPLRGMSDHAVSESVYLDDPDGNGLEIYADRPRST